MHIGNYRLTYQVNITIGDGVPDDVYAEVYHAGSEIYEWTEGHLWVADANIIGFNPIYEDEISWVLEPVIQYNAPKIEMYIGSVWDSGRSVNIFAQNNDSYNDYVEFMEYNLSAYVRGQLIDTIPLTVGLAGWPDDQLPYELDMGSVQTYVNLEVGETYTFDSCEISFGEGVVPEGAFVRDEIHGLEEGVEHQDDFQYWENDMGIDGVGFTVTFNRTGSYHFYAVKTINNYQVSKEICIVVGEPELPEVTLHTEQYLTTLYTEGDDVPVGWIDVEFPVDFALFDDDEVYWYVSRIVDENSPEEPVVQLEEGQYDGREMLHLNAYSTGTATGTERYLVEYVFRNDLLAEQVIELTVTERPENLPTGFTIDNNGYQFREYADGGMFYLPREGGEFTFLHEDIKFVGGEIPEDAAVRIEVGNVGGRIESVQWHDNGLDCTLTFPAGDYDSGFYVVVCINNHCIYNGYSFQVGSGSPK